MLTGCLSQFFRAFPKPSPKFFFVVIFRDSFRISKRARIFSSSSSCFFFWFCLSCFPPWLFPRFAAMILLRFLLKLYSLFILGSLPVFFPESLPETVPGFLCEFLLRFVSTQALFVRIFQQFVSKYLLGQISYKILTESHEQLLQEVLEKYRNKLRRKSREKLEHLGRTWGSNIGWKYKENSVRELWKTLKEISGKKKLRDKSDDNLPDKSGITFRENYSKILEKSRGTVWKHSWKTIERNPWRKFWRILLGFQEGILQEPPEEKSRKS